MYNLLVLFYILYIFYIFFGTVKEIRFLFIVKKFWRCLRLNSSIFYVKEHDRVIVGIYEISYVYRQSQGTFSFSIVAYFMVKILVVLEVKFEYNLLVLCRKKT